MLLLNPLEVKANLNIEVLYIFKHFVWGDLQKCEAATAANCLSISCGLELWKPILCVFSVSAVALLLVAFSSPLSALGESKLEAEGEDKWRLK